MSEPDEKEDGTPECSNDKCLKSLGLDEEHNYEEGHTCPDCGELFCDDCWKKAKVCDGCEREICGGCMSTVEKESGVKIKDSGYNLCFDCVIVGKLEELLKKDSA